MPVGTEEKTDARLNIEICYKKLGGENQCCSSKEVAELA